MIFCLSNGLFVQNAPAQVLEMERKKKADTEQKMQVIEEQLKSL